MILESINWKRNLGCELEQLYIWNKKNATLLNTQKHAEKKKRGGERKKDLTRHYLQVVL